MNIIKNKVDFDDERPWWDFGYSVWLLLIGLILFNIGVFINPVWVDKIISFLDFRRWHWTTFILCAINFYFIVTWTRIVLCKLNDDWDTGDPVIDRSFLFMSITIFLGSVVLGVLSSTKAMTYIHYTFIQWFGYGIYSHKALLILLLSLSYIGVTFYFVKEWIMSILNSRYR